MAPDAKVLLAAVAQGAEIRKLGDEFYAFVPYEAGGWWVYKLDIASPDYYVNQSQTRCTCDGFARSQRCKHIAALRG